nr:unnamed protein product [Callosobruchus analis]
MIVSYIEQRILFFSYAIPVPELTDEGHCVAFLRIASENSNILDLDPYMIFSHIYNIAEVRLHEDVALGDIYVYDMAYFPVRQIARLNPVLMRKGTVPLEKVFSSRVKALHFLNTPAYAEPLIKLVKQLLNPKLSDRIHIHDSLESLRKFLPNKVLPKEYGGDLPPLEEINETWVKAFEKYADRFEKMATLKVNEQLRPTPLVNDDILGTALPSTFQDSLVHVYVTHAKMACLALSKEEAIQMALNQLGRSEKDLQAEVEALKEWLKTQKHLPEMPEDHMLINQILSNKFHMEKTKKKIEMYYAMKSILPDIFKNRNPKLPHMKDIARQVALFPLGVTEAGHGVTVIWMNMNKNEQTPNPYDVLTHVINSIEVMSQEAVLLPGIVIHDYQNEWNKNFEKYADRFDKLDEMKIDETLRSTPLEDDELLGIYGHFRKLDID